MAQQAGPDVSKLAPEQKEQMYAAATTVRVRVEPEFCGCKGVGCGRWGAGL